MSIHIAGLKNYVKQLEKGYQDDKVQNSGMSRADFWALCGIEALQEGRRRDKENANDPGNVQICQVLWWYCCKHLLKEFLALFLILKFCRCKRAHFLLTSCLGLA